MRHLVVGQQPRVHLAYGERTVANWRWEGRGQRRKGGGEGEDVKKKANCKKFEKSLAFSFPLSLYTTPREAAEKKMTGRGRGAAGRFTTILPLLWWIPCEQGCALTPMFSFLFLHRVNEQALRTLHIIERAIESHWRKKKAS